MKLGIMQPYLFPYIGYFQLINAVETFVIYDDVNFIKQGWINRNRILVNGKEHMFSLALTGASSNKLINDITTGDNAPKILKTIAQSYSKAPHFEQALTTIESVLLFAEKNLGRYLAHGIQALCSYFHIPTRILVSSDVPKNCELRGQDKVIEICKVLGASSYINAIGGKELYDHAEFSRHGILLSFIKSRPHVYRQFDDGFVPWLSIIDAMMFNSVEQIHTLLNSYDLE